MLFSSPLECFWFLSWPNFTRTVNIFEVSLKWLVMIAIIFLVVLAFIMTGGFGLEYFQKGQ